MHIYRLINRIIRMTCAGILVELHICETETIDRSMQLFQKKKKKIRTTFEEEKTMYLLFDEITLLSLLFLSANQCLILILFLIL